MPTVHVAVGRIRLRPDASRMHFHWLTMCAWLQARRAPGNLRASLRGGRGRTFWSLSVWESPERMRAYRNSGSHLRAMRASRELAEHVEFRHWEAQSVPTLSEAIRAFARSSRRDSGSRERSG